MGIGSTTANLSGQFPLSAAGTIPTIQGPYRSGLKKKSVPPERDNPAQHVTPPHARTTRTGAGGTIARRACFYRYCYRCNHHRPHHHRRRRCCYCCYCCFPSSTSTSSSTPPPPLPPPPTLTTTPTLLLLLLLLLLLDACSILS